MRQLLTMTGSDLRQRVRDKSVLIYALVVPLALMYVFNMVFGDTENLELQPVTVAVAVPADDELAAPVRTVLGELDAGFEVAVFDVAADDLRGHVDDGTADLGLIVPDGFGAAVTAGQPVAVEAIEGDGAGVETDIVLSVVDGMLAQYTAGAQAASAALASGIPPGELAQLAQEAATAGPDFHLTQGQASVEQLDGAGALVAGQAGLFLMFTVGFGVLGLVTEREQGTLARLRSMPMHPGLIVATKALVSFVLGVVATGILLTIGARMFGTGFGSPVMVGVLILCVVAASTSLMFIIARIARTTEQASIAQSIVALVLGIGGGAFFPVSGAGLLGQLLDLNPVAAFIRGLGITAGGGGLRDLATPIVIMLGFAAVMAVVSRLVPDRGANA